jgi:hypothetical protein
MWILYHRCQGQSRWIKATFHCILLYLLLLQLFPIIPSASLEEDSMSDSQSFFGKLESRIAQVDSHLCVGLDPHIKELFPEGDGHSRSEEERCDRAFEFCKRLIDATGKFYLDYKEAHVAKDTFPPHLLLEMDCFIPPLWFIMITSHNSTICCCL